MRRKCRFQGFAVLAVSSALLWSATGYAQNVVDSQGSTTPTDANPFERSAPAGGGLQREYARLAQSLNSGDVFEKREAAETLLKVRPSDVANADTRKLIARGYKAMAEDERGFGQENAIRGLVIWGGKHSVPIIIEMMEKEGRHPSEEYFNALARLKDPRGAEAMAKYLGDFFSHDEAVTALRRMGSAAEDALIAAAPSSNPDASAAAVLLLGDVGSDKSLAILTKASSARNPQVKQAARDAIKKIRQRQKTGESPDTKADDPDSPFAEGGPPIDIRENALGSDEEVANVNEGDWSEVKALMPGDPTGAGVPADPDRQIFDPQWKPAPIRLGTAMSRNERPEHITVAGGNSPVAVVLHADPFSKSIARLEYLNLKKRDVSKSSNIVGGATGIRLSPGASRLLMVSKDASQKDTARLDVFKIDNGLAVEELSWWPFASSGDFGEGDIKWLEWVDEDQLLTLNGKGSLVLWRLEGKNAKAIYQLDAGGSVYPVLSSGRAQLALATGRGVDIYRVTDGELLARIGGSAGDNPVVRFHGHFWGGGSLAFNRAGNRLALVENGNVSVWNTMNGKLERDFYCNNLTGGSVEWLGDAHLLVGGTDIVDLERRLIAWRYANPMLAATSYGGWRWLVLRSGNTTGIAPVQMLQPEVLEEANKLDADEVLALKPGAKVTLDVQLGGEEQARAETALKASIEKNGMEVVSDSTIRISAQIVTGNTETKEYSRRFFGRGEDSEQVTTTEKRYEVEVTVDGEPVFKHVGVMQSAGGPGLVSLREGESAQQVIDRENAQRAANFRFDVSLPRYVVKPKYSRPLGTSQVSIHRR
jgi:hypothetical protein